MDVDFDFQMLFVISVGDKGDLMAAGIALLVVNEGMHVVAFEEVLGTALSGQVILVPVRIIGKRNLNALVGLVFLCFIEIELQSCGVSHYFSDLVDILKSRKKI